METKVEIHAREICDWLVGQARFSDGGGGVVELDGGVESAVAAVLAQRALGGAVQVLVFTRIPQCGDVDSIVERFGFSLEEVNLSAPHGELMRLLPGAGGVRGEDAMSRLRMLVLRHFAAVNDFIVIGALTREQWEAGIIPGDGAGAADAYPLLHLSKREVVDLAEYLEIPDSVIRAARSSGVEAGVPPGSGASSPWAEAARRALIEKSPPVSGFSLLPSLREAPVDGPGKNEAYDKSIEALTLISQAITSDRYLEDILRLIVMVTAEVMNSSVCSLWLVDEKEAVLRLRATQSINSEYLEERVLRVGEGVVGMVVQENRAYTAANVLEDPFFKEKGLARRMGLVSMLSMPMRVKDKVMGVINCYTAHPHVFSDLQMNVLTAVANQAAVAIVNTELMVKTEVIREELERRKLIERAKDLVMKRLGLSGEDAYRWLQKRSMNTRKSMREVSEAVLLAMEG